jgi:hypothetical protein
VFPSFSNAFFYYKLNRIYYLGGFMKKLKKSRPAKKAKKNKKSGLKLKRLARKKKLLKAHAK